MGKKITVYDNNINAEIIESHVITGIAQSQFFKDNKMLFHSPPVSKSHD